MQDALEAGAPHIILATGSTWRRDGVGRSISRPLQGNGNIFTPDDLMNGNLPTGKVLIFDDDHYYMGGVLAELLATNGCEVTLMTPAPTISAWTEYTLEQDRIYKRLLSLNVTLLPHHILASHTPTTATVTHAVTNAEATFACDAIVMVTDRIPNDSLYHELKPIS